MAAILIGTEDGLFELDGSAERRLAGAVTALTPMWAIVDRTRVMERTGDGWQERLASPPGSVELTCLTAAGGTALVGSSAGELYRMATGPGRSGSELRVLPGFANVAGRDRWHAVGSARPYVRSLTTTGAGVVLANVHVGGIPRSTDQGETWRPTIDVDADVHEVRAHPDRADLAFAAAAVGLCRSDDGGATWTVHDEGLHATYCRAVAFAGDAVLVSASTGPFSTKAAVYRGEIDRDIRLERVTGWIAHNVDTGCLDGAGDRAAFGGPDGVVHVSDDGGRSWGVAADGLPPVTAVMVA
jgi:hypothetical protein